jgi:hypothetical protein
MCYKEKNMLKLKKIMGRGAVIIVLFAALITVFHQPMPALSQFGPAPLLVSGSTPVGKTAWQQYPGREGVFVHVNISAQFRSTLIYITSLGGNLGHWGATGATSIYNPTPTGFRVYVRYATGGSLTPAIANQNGWHINWIASSGGTIVSE